MALGVFDDRDGALWVGSDQGLKRLKDGHVTAYYPRLPAQGLPDNLVLSAAQDATRAIGVGTFHRGESLSILAGA